ncbi:MAG: RNA polymerase sigma factor [Brevinema sp.]
MTFEEFYESNKTLVYRLCRAKTSRDLAEESTARAFVEVWKRWDKISQMESPVAYTVTIARNIAYKEYLKSRARMLFGLDTIEDIADSSYSPEDQTIQKETLEQLWDGLKQLSSREQEIIILKDLEERSFQECADILNLSLTAAKSLRHRAREKLAKILEADLGGLYESD